MTEHTQYDFSLHEKVIFRLHRDRFEKVEVIAVEPSGEGDVMGIASYEHLMSGYLGAVIEQEVPMPDSDGVYVLDGVTGTFLRGDGICSDDEFEFNFPEPRPATPDEIDVLS